MEANSPTARTMKNAKWSKRNGKWRFSGQNPNVVLRDPRSMRSLLGAKPEQPDRALRIGHPLNDHSVLSIVIKRRNIACAKAAIVACTACVLVAKNAHQMSHYYLGLPLGEDQKIAHSGPASGSQTVQIGWFFSRQLSSVMRAKH